MINPSTRMAVAKRAYKTLQAIRRAYWYIVGGRREVVFGQRFRFEPSTHFPSFRGLMFPRDEIFSTIVRYGDYVQTHSAYLFLEELKNPPAVVDIGAHHGIYAVLLGKAVQRKNGIVLAVEPNPAAFRVLQGNIRKNNLARTVQCENVAIMDTAGSFRFTDVGDQSRISEFLPGSGLEVQGVPLSLLLKKHSISTVDVMIIDVEGAELKVLESIDWAECQFKRIYCELHPYNWKHFGYSGNEMREFMTQHGFRCFDMYLREHKEFSREDYLGPTLFVSQRGQ